MLGTFNKTLFSKTFSYIVKSLIYYTHFIFFISISVDIMNSIVSKVQIWDKFKDMKFNDLKIWVEDKKEFFQCANYILCADTKYGRMPGPDKQ